MKETITRKKIISVIGSASCDNTTLAIAKKLGKRICDNNFRVATGGLGGVMEAVCMGAKESENYSEGDTLGVLPTYDVGIANKYVDIIIPTGLGFARNTILVAMGAVTIAVAGGAGTLSEISLAYQLRKPVILIDFAGGWAKKMSDLLKRSDFLDHRKSSPIKSVSSIDEAMNHLNNTFKTTRNYKLCWS